VVVKEYAAKAEGVSRPAKALQAEMNEKVASYDIGQPSHCNALLTPTPKFNWRWRRDARLA